MNKQGSKSTFINNLFGSKKKEKAPLMQQSSSMKKKMSSNTNRWLEKMDQQNRKPLTDGRIRLAYDQDDQVRQDSYQETRDQDRDDLERECLRKTNYIENVKSGQFSRIDPETVTLLLAQQAKRQKQLSKTPQKQVVQQEINETLQKGSLFFQGSLCGLSAMHVMLIFLDDDNIRHMSSYGQAILRLSQIFYVFSLISFLGAFHGLVQTIRQNQTRQQKADYFKFLIPSLAFGAMFALVIYNHRFVVDASVHSKEMSTYYPNLASQHSTYKYMCVLQAFLAVVGWVTFVVFSKSDQAALASEPGE